MGWAGRMKSIVEKNPSRQDPRSETRLQLVENKNSSGINRRNFLKTSACAALVSNKGLLALSGNKSSTTSRVVRIHDKNATMPWDYTANAPWDHTVEPNPEKGITEKTAERYFDYINEDIVAEMLNKGLLELTGADSSREAWKDLLPGFSISDKITLKVNLNNATYDPDLTNNRMDQTMPLVNSVLSHLVRVMKVPENQITITDAKRWIHPVIIKGRCRFPGVQWIDSTVEDRWDPSESVVFSKHQPKPGGDFRMPKSYTQADHIINLCLMKNHGCGITGAMKNHFGSIPSPKFLHEGLGFKGYIADLCNTKSIREKVRINIADALFANWHNNVWAPRPWNTFPEPSPNSLLFSTDPVALDSVMLDHITKEIETQGDNAPQWVRDCVKNHDFLEYAMEHYGLGIHEHRPYKLIDYREIG